MSKNSPLMIDLGQGISLMLGIPSITCWDNNKRPKICRKGTIGFNSDTNHLEFWDGDSWWKTEMTEA